MMQKEAFVFVERSRARNFQDRLASPSPAHGPDSGSSRLDEIRKYLDPSSILLSMGSGNRLALICYAESYGIHKRSSSC